MPCYIEILDAQSPGGFFWNSEESEEIELAKQQPATFNFLIPKMRSWKRLKSTPLQLTCKTEHSQFAIMISNLVCCQSLYKLLLGTLSSTCPLICLFSIAQVLVSFMRICMYFIHVFWLILCYHD